MAEKGAWAYPGTAHFRVPHIISGIGKDTNFKLCTHIHRIDENKSPLNIPVLVAVVVLGDSRKILVQPYMGASLCGSSDFLFSPPVQFCHNCTAAIAAILLTPEEATSVHHYQRPPSQSIVDLCKDTRKSRILCL